MQSKRFVQLGDEVLLKDSDPGDDSPDVHGSDVLGLCLGVSVEPGCRVIDRAPARCGASAAQLVLGIAEAG